MENHSSPKRKVLVITYYWPPSGGSPVLRWLKFSKYLPVYGWQPTIYTPENPVPQAIDESLLNEIPEGITVLKRKIWEPHQVLNKISGKGNQKTQSTSFISETGKESFLQQLSVWIRGNLFIPDARKYWINPSINYLHRYLKTHPHDLILSTGPPHSMHLIGRGLKQKTGIPWVADFRDPWTNIDFYSQLRLTKLADSVHHKLEKEVLDQADAVVTIGPTMTREFEQITDTPVTTITNGFDSEIMESIDSIPDIGFSVLHVGSMPQSRNPELLWRVLGKIITDNPNFKEYCKIELIGTVDHSVLQSLHANNLQPCLVKRAHMPNRSVLQRMKEASLLLLVINNTQNATGILTNKFFEYLSAKRPILAVGPTNGDAADILEHTGAGKMIDYEDEAGAHAYLKDLIARFGSGKLEVNVKNIDNFNRKNLTAKLAGLFDSLI